MSKDTFKCSLNTQEMAHSLMSQGRERDREREELRKLMYWLKKKVEGDEARKVSWSQIVNSLANYMTVFRRLNFIL